MESESEILEALRDIRDTLSRIERKLFPVPNPGPGLLITIAGENGTMLSYDVALPAFDPAAPNSADTDHGELVVSVNGTPGAPITTTKEQTAVTGLTGNDGDSLHLEFSWVDDAGNKSLSPATLDVTLSDTIPPADPGAGLGITVTGES